MEGLEARGEAEKRRKKEGRNKREGKAVSQIFFITKKNIIKHNRKILLYNKAEFGRGQVKNELMKCTVDGCRLRFGTTKIAHEG